MSYPGNQRRVQPGQIGKNLLDYVTRGADESEFDAIMKGVQSQGGQPPQMSHEDAMSAILRNVSPQRQTPYLGLLKQKGLGDYYEKQGIPREVALLPESVQAKMMEREVKQKLANEEKDTLQNVFNQAIDVIGRGNTGLTSAISGAFNPATRADRAELGTLAMTFEQILRKAAAGGRIGQDVFKILMGKLPQPGNTDATNVGHLKAIAVQLGMDTTKLDELERKIRGSSRSNKSSASPSVSIGETETVSTPKGEETISLEEIFKGVK